MLNKLCYDEQPDVIIGTSMGAMYAQQLHGYQKILVNPAFHLSEIMRRSMGVNKFMLPRADGVMKFNITDTLCQEYERMEQEQFNGITAFDKKHTYAFFGTGDTLVNGFDEYLQYYTNATQYPGEHALLQKWVKAVKYGFPTSMIDTIIPNLAFYLSLLDGCPRYPRIEPNPYIEGDKCCLH